MTKSTITRERLEEIVSDPMINQGSEFAMLALMALAAMDSDPVEMPLDYLQGHKDGLEWAAEAPDDISEFADILMLVWDATRRAGFSDEQLAEAVAEKLERNKRRAWGEVKDGEPCHHVKN